MTTRTKSSALFETAKKLMPGGVNSPVRAFKSVTGDPIFFKKGKGSRVWDEDDNCYIDFCCSWGPLICGHAHPEIVESIQNTAANGTSFGAPTALENELASLIIENHSYIEMIRFVSSGTEAVMSALRLARGVTGKDKIVKFEGCYHGHVDSMLVKAGSGLVTFGESTSAGIPQAFALETIVLPLHNIEILKETLQNHRDDIAAVIIEPIPANNGLLLQGKDFLAALRQLCTENGILLIFDEVISGFRVGFEGAAGYYGIAPDIITFGKIIGGGMPVGAYASSQEIMSHISPLGAVYQAGTLSGNPVAMAAGIAQLKRCLKSDFYSELEKKTNFLVTTIREGIRSTIPVRIFHIGSIFWIAFSNADEIQAADEIVPDSMHYFKQMFNYLLDHGVYFGPSGYEVGFVSEAHTYDDLQYTAQQCIDAINSLK